MDVVELARQRAGDDAARQADVWLEEMARGDQRAQAAHRHLRAEQNLPACATGRAAIERLLARLPARAGDGLFWYIQQLSHEALELTCQGPAAGDEFPDDLCRLETADTVARYLARPDVRPVAEASDWDRDALAQWAEEVCAAPPQRSLDGASAVRGPLPTTFVASHEDLRPLVPSATVGRLRQALGMEPPHWEEEPHILLLFRRPQVGPCFVPTAFDAGEHLHFRSPPSGASCGRTLDLSEAAGAGAREGVARPFPARQLRGWHSLPARSSGGLP